MRLTELREYIHGLIDSSYIELCHKFDLGDMADQFYTAIGKIDILCQSDCSEDREQLTKHLIYSLVGQIIYHFRLAINENCNDLADYREFFEDKVKYHLDKVEYDMAGKYIALLKALQTIMTKEII